MGLGSILLFFAYTYGMGFSISRVAKNSENFIERNIMRIGIGLAAFVVLGIILNAVGIPLDWKIFLAASLIPAAIIGIKGYASGKGGLELKIKQSDIITLLVFAVFAFSLYMYANGALSYPYLEDEDPWGHATGAKYVSIEKKAFDTPSYNFAYIDPYPPGYDILMGILHQTEPSIQFTLKFFNALIIALGILWFYFMARNFIGSGKAAFATFVLAMIPSYFTHFIWAHTLVIALFFPASYALWRIKEDRLWAIPAAILVAAMLLTQPDQPIKLAVMIGIFLAVSAWHYKKIPIYELAAGVGGLLISLVWWAPKGPEMFKYAMGIGVGGTAFNPAGGSASRAYTIGDYLFPNQTLINVPPGFGFLISMLIIMGIIVAALNYKKILNNERPWLAMSLLWLIFTFIGTNSATFNLPIGLNPFRFWLLLAIPAAILAAEGAWLLSHLIRMPQVLRIGVLLILASSIFLTSGIYKYSINNSSWYGGPLHVEGELPGFIWLLSLPHDTKVLTFEDDSFMIGFDKFSCAWCPEVIEFKKSAYERTPEEISRFMKRNGYEYLILASVETRYNEDGTQTRYINETIARKEMEMANSTYFSIANVYENGVVAAFRIT